jgi:MYXO-CTERM domain-containing protein
MHMKTMTTTAVAVLAVAAVTPAAAGAQSDATRPTDRAAFQERGDDQVVLRRDGDRAVPFVPRVNSSSATKPDSFDWGDAAVGGAGAFGLMALAMAAGAAVHRRRRSGHLDAGGLADLRPIAR